MKRLIMPLALGTVLAGAVAAFAAETPHRPVSGYRATDYWSFAPFAAPADGAREDPPRADPFIPREKDGLSSDPDACVNYGCVDAGGGGD
jgi:hypothetical protein